jgi:hypothetical protein
VRAIGAIDPSGHYSCGAAPASLPPEHEDRLLAAWYRSVAFFFLGFDKFIDALRSEGPNAL